MSTALQEPAEEFPPKTSVTAKLVNLFVSPTLVFDEIVASAPKSVNWLLPTLLVCVSSLLVLTGTTNAERTLAAIGQLTDGGKITPEQVGLLSGHWQSVSRAAICLGAFIGTFWSAFVLWFIGRIFLKNRFEFAKALEVAGLTSTILVLGTIVTGLLVAAFGEASARPALSLLLVKVDPASGARVAADVFNCFHLWSTAVLAIGLAKLSGVSIKEAGFWVFGYWVVLRIAFILLA